MTTPTLSMARGNPCAEQLALSNALLSSPGENDFKTQAGIDCRNYPGASYGLPECRALFADYMEVKPEELFVIGSSSLNLMRELLVQALLFGVEAGAKPWKDVPVTFLCPSPGYDRHFQLCEHLGIKMIAVSMLEDGPDMDQVEKLCREDESIRGIWCVPKYSNPTGTVYSDDTVKRLAALKTKASDFRIFWDNAYQGHTLTDSPAPLANILRLCEEAGNPPRVSFWLNIQNYICGWRIGTGGFFF
jgi:DNA-binding transcriptional MocR family regulator